MKHREEITVKVFSNECRVTKDHSSYLKDTETMGQQSNHYLKILWPAC